MSTNHTQPLTNSLRALAYHRFFPVPFENQPIDLKDAVPKAQERTDFPFTERETDTFTADLTAVNAQMSNLIVGKGNIQDFSEQYGEVIDDFYRAENPVLFREEPVKADEQPSIHKLSELYRQLFGSFKRLQTLSSRSRDREEQTVLKELGSVFARCLQARYFERIDTEYPMSRKEIEVGERRIVDDLVPAQSVDRHAEDREFER